MTAAQASLPPAPDETLRRGQGLGRAASLSAEGRRRGRLRGADGGCPSDGVWRVLPSSAGHLRGGEEGRLVARTCVS